MAYSKRSPETGLSSGRGISDAVSMLDNTMPEQEANSHFVRTRRLRKESTGLLIPEPTAEVQESTQSPMGSMRVRDIPVGNIKHKAVWQRVRAKVKSKLYIKRLGMEIQLFGANTIALHSSNIDTHIINDITRKKLQAAGHIQEAVVKQDFRGLFMPGSVFKGLWSAVYIALMLYTAFVMPFVLAFEDDDNFDVWYFIDITIDFLFFIDILVTLNSARYGPSGELITSRCAIFLSYLKSWLVLDLIACFPIYIFDQGNSSLSASSNRSVEYKNFLRLARLPRLYRLLRLTRIFKFVRSYKSNQCLDRAMENLFGKGSVLRMVAFFSMVAISVHLMSCLWFFTARLEGLSPDTWVSIRGLRDSSASDLYIASLFWTITTLSTVGYGDIVPQTSIERVLAIIWMLFGVCVFSFTIGSLGNMINGIDTKETLLANKLAAIDEFATESKLDKSLRYRLRHALRYAVEQTGFTTSDKRNIFNDLPRQLKYEVALAMHHGAAKSIPFFTDRDQVFVSSIVPFLTSQYVQAAHVIYREKEHADEIYFITEGRCVVLLYGKHVIKKLQSGSYFGEIEVMQQVQRKFTVSAATDVELLIMSKRMLYVIKKEFPAVYEEMKDVAATRNHLNEQAKEQFLKLLSLYKAGKVTGDEEQFLRQRLNSVESEASPQKVEAPVLQVPKVRITKAESDGRQPFSIELETQVKDLDQRVHQMEAGIKFTKSIAMSIFSALKTRNSSKEREPQSEEGSLLLEAPPCSEAQSQAEGSVNDSIHE